MSRIMHNLSGSRLGNVIEALGKAAKSLECYFAVLLIFYEAVFHWLITGEYGEYLMLKVIFGLFFGYIIGVVVNLIGGLPAKITGLIITILFMAFFIAHTVYYGVFATHMSLTGSIGTADQALDFTDVIASELKADWWKILIMVLPLIFYIFVVWRHSNFKRHSKKGFLLNGMAVVVIFLTMKFSVAACDDGIYSPYKLMENYQSVDMSVRKLGVIETLCLELFNGDGNGKVSFHDEGDNPLYIDGTDTTEDTSVSTEDPTTENGTTEDVTTEEPTTEVVIDTSPNILDIDFDKLIAEENDPNIIALHEYIKTQTPTNKNEYTGKFKGYNLIFVVAEGFDGYMIDEERTPQLYKMSHQGFHFKNFYTPLWYGSTLGGEFADLTGLMPMNGSYLSMDRCGSRKNDMLFTLSQELLREGYKVTGYHDNDYEYYDRHISHTNMGYSWYGVGNGYEPERYDNGTQIWPQSDLRMIETTFDEYAKDQPFHTYYLTVSGHVMYNFGGNEMASRHRDVVEDLDYSETTKAYLACQYELELAMAALEKKLEQAGIADNTLIVLVADHVPYDNKEVVDELAGKTLDNTFEWYRNSLIIYSPSMEEHVEVDKYCSSLDILPTVLNLMGLPYDSRMMVGQDILSDSPALIVFNDRSFITDYCKYNANTGEVTNLTMRQVSDEYIDSMNKYVSNKFNMAQSIVDNNYYSVIDQAVYGNSENEHNER